jgi:hypothetical protein
LVAQAARLPHEAQQAGRQLALRLLGRDARWARLALEIGGLV